MLPSPWISALGAACLVACVACSGSHAGQALLSGRVASGGGALGDWDFYPTACAVHDTEILLSEGSASRRSVRLVDRSPPSSAVGAKVDVHVAKQTATGAVDVVFTDPSCVTGALASGPSGYRGEVSLDCRTVEGGHVVGKVTFGDCR